MCPHIRVRPYICVCILLQSISRVRSTCGAERLRGPPVPALARINLESGRSLKEVGLGKTRVDIERLLACEDSSSIIAECNRCQVVVVVKGHAVAEESRRLFRRSRIFDDEIAAIPRVGCC